MVGLYFLKHLSCILIIFTHHRVSQNIHMIHVTLPLFLIDRQHVTSRVALSLVLQNVTQELKVLKDKSTHGGLCLLKMNEMSHQRIFCLSKRWRAEKLSPPVNVSLFAFIPGFIFVQFLPGFLKASASWKFAFYRTPPRQMP